MARSQAVRCSADLKGRGQWPDSGVAREGLNVEKGKLLELADGDTDFVQELVEAFTDDAPKRLIEIQQALKDGNLEALGTAAHTLKGAVGNFDVGPAYEATRRLEELARSGEREGTEEAGAETRIHVEALIQALEKIVASL